MQHFSQAQEQRVLALSKRSILICQLYISPVPHIRVVDIFRKWVFVMFLVYPRHSMSYHILTVRRIPADYIAKLFSELGMHERRRFSGRYETILWFTKGDDYTFNLMQCAFQTDTLESDIIKERTVGSLRADPRLPFSVFRARMPAFPPISIIIKHPEKMR